jgi:glycosyl-4,4'-diaponeurosporenoate acyltransferase
MLIKLSFAWVFALNFIAWLVIQFGLAWSFTQVALERFDHRSWCAGPRIWERKGRFYERVFAIKLWKDRLPDASRIFRGGFAKARLQTAAPEYLERFLRETWRGEVVHWLALLALPVFFVWNPWWGMVVNAVVALLLNLPCILALRYNRARLQRLLARRTSTSTASSP